ncbi:hypothetical protein ACTI_04090 [Actinoplanes sp. OR16]|uniref:hypothetical protein n=1 Tax=Actinoplanes sp. OR16 TaxID=946334 RepID=UPI000F6FBE37|nr:hypothetical protein [Actinoplanes sp. OR16]BBH63724.1 hypothetical protein ACTI_04090 [Actinoplanes sp. OR16]
MSETNLLDLIAFGLALTVVTVLALLGQSPEALMTAAGAGSALYAVWQNKNRPKPPSSRNGKRSGRS